MVTFYSLRLSFAPLLESVFLLDRGLYLLERGIESLIVPIFDPAQSPRNFALIAVKPGRNLCSSVDFTVQNDVAGEGHP